MLRFEEALARVLALGAPALPPEDVPLDEADGRVLAEEVVAPFDLPGFDYSAMDGYAVRAADLDGALPARLPVRGESRTGALAPALEPGSAMRIFTGAPMPLGADAVVMQEEVTREGEDAVFARAPRAFHFVRKRGDDLAAGTAALAKGTRLRPAHLALAAACDRASLRVARRPVVAVLATGDELRAPGSPARDGAIPEVNTWALRAMARRAGAVAYARAYVPDDRAATERAFAEALDDADVVVTIGGVSVGDHDLVRPALAAVGVHIELWRVAIKPGKPLVIGRRAGKDGARGTLVVGLPGNPSSAMVTMAVFGVPLLRALQGDATPFPPFVRARLAGPIAHEPGRLELARAVLTRGAELVATPIGNQASGAPTSMAQAGGLVCIPAEQGSAAAGDEVDVLLLADLGG
jgi:molybdopterin molybdotransferase